MENLYFKAGVEKQLFSQIDQISKKNFLLPVEKGDTIRTSLSFVKANAGML